MLATLLTWLKDARFWILILFLIRLENIDLPPLDVHAYRQTHTLGVARNFLEQDANIFRPRTIVCDSREGYHPSEFPVYNYCVYLLWAMFGEQHWCFRLLSLLTASFGLWAFYRICTRWLSKEGALVAMVLFGSSIAFIYGRKGMPDVFAVSLVLIGANWGWNFLESGKNWQAVLFAWFVSLGILSKIPAAGALSLLAVPFFDKQISIKRKVVLTAAGLIALVPVYCWYFVWLIEVEKETAHGFFFRLPFNESMRRIFIDRLSDTWHRFNPIAFQSPFTFWFCLAGLLLAILDRKWKLLTGFGLFSLIFLYFMRQVGDVFSGHEYYVIPYIPAMAMMGGYCMQTIFPNQWVLLLVMTGLAAYSISNQKHDFFIEYKNQKFLNLKTIADQYIPPKTRVLTNGMDGSAVSLYMAHRQGWQTPDRMRDSAWLSGESTVGLHYAIIERSVWKDTVLYPMIYEDNEFRIYKIKKDNN